MVKWLVSITTKFTEINYDIINMNVEKTKVMRISRQSSPVTIMIDQKQLENVECFKYLGSMLTNDRNVRVKLNVGLPWEKMSSTRRFSLLANWT